MRTILGIVLLLAIASPAQGQISEAAAYEEFSVEFKEVLREVNDLPANDPDRSSFLEALEAMLHHYKQYADANQWEYGSRLLRNQLRTYKQHLAIKAGRAEAPKTVSAPTPVPELSAEEWYRRWKIKSAKEAAERAAESREFVRSVEAIIFEAGQATATKSERADLRAVEFMLKQYKEHVAANEWAKADELKESMRVSLARSGQVASEAPRRIADWQRAAEERRHRELAQQRERQHQEFLQQQQRQHNELINGLWLRDRHRQSWHRRQPRGVR